MISDYRMVVAEVLMIMKLVGEGVRAGGVGGRKKEM
jgi:hypothetical protein